MERLVSLRHKTAGTVNQWTPETAEKHIAAGTHERIDPIEDPYLTPEHCIALELRRLNEGLKLLTDVFLAVCDDGSVRQQKLNDIEFEKMVQRSPFCARCITLCHTMVQHELISEDPPCVCLCHQSLDMSP